MSSRHVKYTRFTWIAVRFLSGAILVLACALGGTVFVDLAILVHVLPESWRTFSITTVLVSLVLLPWTTEGTREHAVRGWLRLNRAVAQVLYGLLVALNYNYFFVNRHPRWHVYLLAAAIIPIITFAGFAERHQATPLIRSLFSDIAEFVNTVSIRSHTPSEIRALRIRYESLQTMADSVYPDLRNLVSVITKLFPDSTSTVSPALGTQSFEGAVLAAARSLDVKGLRGRGDDSVLSRLFAARLYLHLSKQGAETEYLMKSLDALLVTGEPPKPTSVEAGSAGDPYYSELWKNTRAVILAFCTEHYGEYELWSDGMGQTPKKPDELYKEARQLFSSIVLNTSVSDRSKYRAVNNLAGLEFKRLISSTKLSSDHGSSRSSSPTSAPDSEEAQLAELLSGLDQALINDPRPATMITYAQIHYLLAHADSHRYAIEAREPEKSELLKELQMHLGTTVRYLEMAMICGQPDDRFDKQYETLKMDRLLAPDEQAKIATGRLDPVIQKTYEDSRRTFKDFRESRKKKHKLHGQRTSP